MDQDWRELQRAWEATPSDQALLSALVAARRRAGLPVPDRLTRHVVRPPRTFALPPRCALRYVPPGEARGDGTFAEGRPLRVPEHRDCVLEVEAHDATLAWVADRFADDAEPPGLRLFAAPALAEPTLARLTRLRWLEVHALGERPDAWFAVLPALRDLEDLRLGAADAVTTAGLEPLRSLRALTRLRLDRLPRVHDVTWVAELASLSQVALRGMPVGDPSVVALGACEELESVELDHCRRVTDEGVLRLTRLPRLTELLVDACPRVSLRVTGGLPALKRLSLTGPPAGHVSPLGELPPSLERLALTLGAYVPRHSLRGLGRLASLRELELHAAGTLDDATVASLAALPALESLTLRGAAALTVAALEHLGRAPRLRHLVLDECVGLARASLEALAQAGALRRLQLSRTPLAPDALSRLGRITTLEALTIDEPGRSIAPREAQALAPLSRLAHLHLNAPLGWFGSTERLEQALRAALPRCDVRLTHPA